MPVRPLWTPRGRGGRVLFGGGGGSGGDPCASQVVGPGSAIDAVLTGITPILWYTVRDIVQADETSVGSWPGHNGVIGAATRGTAAEQPLYRKKTSDAFPGGSTVGGVTTYKNVPVVRFQTSSSGLDMPVAAGITDSNGLSVLMAMRTFLSPGAFATAFSNQAVAGGVSWEPHDLNGNATFTLDGQTATTPSTCFWQVWGLRASPSDAKITIWNLSATVIANHSWSPNGNAFSAWVLGSAHGFAVGIPYDLLEVQAFASALSDNNMASMIQQLRSSWGI